MEGMNLINLLEKTPTGVVFFSKKYGDVVFECIIETQMYPAIKVRLKNGSWRYYSYQGVDIDGSPFIDLFPSKQQRDWTKFNKNKES